MFTRFTRQRAMATGLACLLFVSLVLAACGGTTESASEESTASGEAEEVVQPAAENEEQAQESQAATSAEEEMTAAEESEATSEESGAEESVAEEAEAADNENLLAPGQELASSGPAECRTVTPDNDPIAAVLQPNELIAPISDSDWTKGPTDAPITLIEYGDFQ